MLSDSLSRDVSTAAARFIVNYGIGSASAWSRIVLTDSLTVLSLSGDLNGEG